MLLKLNESGQLVMDMKHVNSIHQYFSTLLEIEKVLDELINDEDLITITSLNSSVHFSNDEYIRDDIITLLRLKTKKIKERLSDLYGIVVE